MLVQAVTLVLCEHVDLADPAVDQVGQREIDQPVEAAEGHGCFGPLCSQRRESLPLSARQDNSQCLFASHLQPPPRPVAARKRRTTPNRRGGRHPQRPIIGERCELIKGRTSRPAAVLLPFIPPLRAFQPGLAAFPMMIVAVLTVLACRVPVACSQVRAISFARWYPVASSGLAAARASTPRRARRLLRASADPRRHRVLPVLGRDPPIKREPRHPWPRTSSLRLARPSAHAASASPFVR
jgi:hypothetical protein